MIFFNKLKSILFFTALILFNNNIYCEDNISEIFDHESLKSFELQNRLDDMKKRIFEIDTSLNQNIWIKRYDNYLTYRKIENDLVVSKKNLKKYNKKKGESWKEKAYQLKNKIKIKENELELISEYKESPIGNKIKPQDIATTPQVTNPIAIIEAFSYVEHLKEEKKQYKKINQQLKDVIELLESKKELISEYNSINNDIEKNIKLNQINQIIKDFIMIVDIVSTTSSIYDKRTDQVIFEVKNAVADEFDRTINIASIIFVLFIITWFIRRMLKIKNYFHDDGDRNYMTNKFINFTAIIISILIIIFNYIENASYLVTFLGFASAGIAIALKDWFMSIFGWIAIMTSGSINVGDRIKVTKNGTEVVGDVLDISLFKISIREDITLTSYLKNRRTGRVFFIPNNYIFTDLIANYTYNNLRTVWDGVDLAITFDSNHEKAVQIAQDIVTKNSHLYTELAKKRLNKMKTKYVLRNMSPEPRIFAFTESYGIVISSWYMTNSYATLSLRSKMSTNILDAFRAEDDIEIAYSTQTLNIAKFKSKNKNISKEIDSKSLFDGE